MKPVKSLLFIFGLFLQTALFSQLTIVADKTIGCDALRVNFSFTIDPPVPITSVRWDFGGGQTGTATNAIIDYNYPGSYNVKLVINETDSVIENDFIQVGLTPVLNILEKDTLAPSTKAIRVITTNGQSPFLYSYDWTIDGNVLVSNSGFIVHTFDTTGVFTANVVATDALGCYNDTSAKITVANGFVVPNVFTPNNDGENDEFKIFSDGKYFITFQLFSKAGMLVYKTTAKTVEWDGKMSSGEYVPAGIYYYIAETTDSTPPVKVKGFLYIYR